MRPDPHAKALHAIMRELMATRDGATAIAGRVWGVTNQYDLGGAHPLIGRSVPNFAFDDGSSLAAAMHDGRALLLDFHGNPALAALSDRHASRIHYIARPAVDTCQLSAVLVRPDGCVAWATDGTPDLPAIELALATWMRLAIAQ